MIGDACFGRPGCARPVLGWFVVSWMGRTVGTFPLCESCAGFALLWGELVGPVAPPEDFSLRSDLRNEKGGVMSETTATQLPNHPQEPPVTPRNVKEESEGGRFESSPLRTRNDAESLGIPHGAHTRSVQNATQLPSEAVAAVDRRRPEAGDLVEVAGVVGGPPWERARVQISVARQPGDTTWARTLGGSRMVAIVGLAGSGWRWPRPRVGEFVRLSFEGLTVRGEVLDLSEHGFRAGGEWGVAMCAFDSHRWELDLEAPAPAAPARFHATCETCGKSWQLPSGQVLPRHPFCSAECAGDEAASSADLASDNLPPYADDPAEAASRALATVTGRDERARRARIMARVSTWLRDREEGRKEALGQALKEVAPAAHGRFISLVGDLYAEEDAQVAALFYEIGGAL